MVSNLSISLANRIVEEKSKQKGRLLIAIVRQIRKRTRGRSCTKNSLQQIKSPKRGRLVHFIESLRSSYTPHAVQQVNKAKNTSRMIMGV
jgi:hypothetical protein